MVFFKRKPLLTVKIGEPIKAIAHLDERANSEFLMTTAYEQMSRMLENDDSTKTEAVVQKPVY